MYTIVVADDEEELRKAILRKMDWSGIGFEVVGEAENGVEALELVEKKEPDLLLTDIRMPFISGIELARQVREVRPATQIVFLSGYDDFTYAQQAIQYNIISYLLKPISMEELTGALIQVRQKMDKQFAEFADIRQAGEGEINYLIPLLLDDMQTDYSQERERLLLEQACQHGLLRENSHFQYCVIITVIRDAQGNNVTNPANVHAINSILHKYLRFRSFFSENKVISLVMGTTAALQKYLHILAGEIVQSMERILHVRCVMGISRPVDRLVLLHEEYREAINAMGYAGNASSGVHYISDEEPSADMDAENLQAMVTEVESLIRGGSGAQLEECLHRLFANVETHMLSRVQLNFLFLQILSAVSRILYAVSEEDPSAELAEDFFFKRMHMFDGNMEEIEERVAKFCKEARDLVADKRKKSSEILTDRALQLIDTRYMDVNLSLVCVSQEIGVSPNYLSSLIKKHTGQTFVDLLTRRRVDEARKLILTTSMKIREISERCGYSDQHYFSYCFKKYVGQSPAAMRQERSMSSAEGGQP